MWHVSSTNDVIFSFTLKKGKKKMERVKGIEPSRPAWKAGALPLSYTRKIKNGRSSRIRTCDPLVPSQVRYQLRYAPWNFFFRVQR